MPAIETKPSTFLTFLEGLSLGVRGEIKKEQDKKLAAQQADAASFRAMVPLLSAMERERGEMTRFGIKQTAEQQQFMATLGFKQKEAETAQAQWQQEHAMRLDELSLQTLRLKQELTLGREGMKSAEEIAKLRADTDILVQDLRNEQSTMSDWVELQIAGLQEFGMGVRQKVGIESTEKIATAANKNRMDIAKLGIGEVDPEIKANYERAMEEVSLWATLYPGREEDPTAVSLFGSALDRAEAARLQIPEKYRPAPLMEIEPGVPRKLLGIDMLRRDIPPKLVPREGAPPPERPLSVGKEVTPTLRTAGSLFNEAVRRLREKGAPMSERERESLRKAGLDPDAVAKAAGS